jgi:hypothetical protein
MTPGSTYRLHARICWLPERDAHDEPMHAIHNPFLSRKGPELPFVEEEQQSKIASETAKGPSKTAYTDARSEGPHFQCSKACAARLLGHL